MTIGRSFPIRNPSRALPIDPIFLGDTYTQRTSPLPFQFGVSPTGTIDTLVFFRLLLQTNVSEASSGGGGTGGGSGVSGGVCNPLAGQFCVPTAVITRAGYPTATIRCTIT